MMDDMSTDLYTNFRSAMGEALLRAGLAAFIVAMGVSIFISRRVVSPVQEITTASQYIAEGHYDQRVQVPGDIASGDLDELAQLALSFNQMAEKLYQTENMRQQLIGDISHELRTPLTQVKGYSDILEAMNEENALTREQTREIIGHIKRATIQLEGLITKISFNNSMVDAINLPRHPSQLYEAFFEGIILFLTVECVFRITNL